MHPFKYNEDIKSKAAVNARYYRFLLSLKKAETLSSDKAKKAVYKEKREVLSKNFNKKDYPACFNSTTPRVAVYTAVFGNYDSIKPVGVKSKFCDYYLFTDGNVDENLGWTVREADFPTEYKTADNVTKNRYLKMHPDVLFPDYDYSIYIDGTVELKYDIFPLLGRMGEGFIAMNRHHVRDCIYSEAQTIIRVGKAKAQEVTALMDRYKEEGLPEHFGLTECNIIVRKHSDQRCKKLMSDWWQMFLNGPKRDQLSFVYCLWKNGYTIADAAGLGFDYRYEPRITTKAHK